MHFLKVTVLFILNIYFVHCLLDPISLTAIGAGGALLGGGYFYLFKRCTALKDPLRLELSIKQNLHGQHIATPIIINAVTRHWQTEHPNKPLVIIFHGPPGTGKNYVASMIAQAMFKDGESSEHYYFFNGRVSFPKNGFTEKYQEELQSKVISALEKCEESLFVFDEVDEMAEGVLNILVPFMDYNKHSFLGKKVMKNKAIFLLLSNAASNIVIEEMITLWKNGMKREELSIKNFEKRLAKGIFNYKGGLYDSDTIRTSVIDHYVPFLPLEHDHVKLCIMQAYQNIHGKIPVNSEIDNIIEMLQFGPENYELYSTSGCKRIHALVSVHSTR